MAVHLRPHAYACDRVAGSVLMLGTITVGKETVPTVQIGSLVLINPTARDVLRTVARELPDQIPEGSDSPEPGRCARFVARVLGGWPTSS